MILRSRFDTVMLDEPDNALDIEGKRWLEDAIAASPKTVLFVSHDRTVLDRAATRIVTLGGRRGLDLQRVLPESCSGAGRPVDRLDQDHRRYEAEHRRLSDMVKEMRRKSAYNDNWASKARRPAPARPVRGAREAAREGRRAERSDAHRGRTHRQGRARSPACRSPRSSGRSTPVWFGERIGVIGPNGTGKTHFMRLLAGEESRTRANGSSGLGSSPPCSPSCTSADVADLPIEVLRKRG